MYGKVELTGQEGESMSLLSIAYGEKQSGFIKIFVEIGTSTMLVIVIFSVALDAFQV